MKARFRMPHPAIVLDDCPQLLGAIEQMEAGTYPLPEVAVWRDDLPRPLAIRLARATGATDEQITEVLAEIDADTTHDVVPTKGDFFALATTCQTCGQPACWRVGAGVWEHTESGL